MGSGWSLRRLGQATGKILEETTMAESASIMEPHAMLVDACKRYDEAIEAAEKPRLKALFDKAKSVHEKRMRKFMRS